MNNMDAPLSVTVNMYIASSFFRDHSVDLCVIRYTKCSRFTRFYTEIVQVLPGSQYHITKALTLLFYSLLFGISYALFSYIYYLAGGTNSSGKVYIYYILDWGNKPGQTVGICLLSLVVVV
ncbi:hypothetical protein BDFB_003020, partial [Asbolus verrucosus]